MLILVEWNIIVIFVVDFKTYKDMKILEPRYEILSQGEGMDGVYKQIELCGRTCYASSMKIDKDSAKPFVELMVSSNHLAMCEHGTIYLHVAYEEGFLYRSLYWSSTIVRTNIQR